MSKIITIYCEGKRGSHDFDILEKTVGDIASIVIKPIGGKRGANAIVEFLEKGTTTSDFYCFFRDRDFDCPVQEKEELYFDEKKTYFSYRTTIENYLFDTSLFFSFLDAKELKSKYSINAESGVENIFIETAKKLKFYQAVRHTLGELRFPNSFDTTWIKGGSGQLPENLDLESCKIEAWQLICNVISKSDTEWAESKFLSVLEKYLNLFDDAFFEQQKFLIYFQGKDFEKALKNRLTDFPLRDYYRFAKEHFDYQKFKDLVELREIVKKKI